MRLRGVVSSMLFRFTSSVSEIRVYGKAKGGKGGGGKNNSRNRLINGLVRNNQVLEIIARGRCGVDQIGGEQQVGNLGALAHDRQPAGQLGVVLGVGERDIVTVVADLLHAFLVDDGPHESVVGALVARLLGLYFGGARKSTRNKLRLSAVKGVENGLHHVGRIPKALKEESQDVFKECGERVEALLEVELDVHKGDVGAPGRVGGELEEGFLLGDVLAALRVGVGQGLGQLVTRLAGGGYGYPRKPDEGELGC